MGSWGFQNGCSPQKAPKRAQGGLLFKPLTVTARLVRPAMYLLAIVNFTSRRCHAEFFDLKNPKDPQPHYIILPKPEQLFSSTHRAITTITPPASLFQVSNNPPRLATASSKPLHRRSDHQLFLSKPPSFSRSLSHRIVYKLFSHPVTEFRHPRIQKHSIASCHASSCDTLRPPSDPRKTFPERGVPPLPAAPASRPDETPNKA